MSYQHYLLIEEAYVDQDDPVRYPAGGSLQRSNPAARLTDVTDFFHDLIDEYLRLEQSVLAVITKAPAATPEELLIDCKSLCQLKRGLADKDEQLISIVSLAGRELVNTPLIHDYRVAFARATLACNNLYQRLKALQVEILEETLTEFVQ